MRDILWYDFVVPNIDDHIVHFQCPNCGFELQQAVGLLKAEQRIVCSGCKIDINIDATQVVAATEALHAAVLPGPNEITIKFFR
jgi:predicted RNA-binding Zn-ribbon protein involved in translation (DUF1610 family)